MQIRTVVVKRNGKTYRYTQLVESYRRKKDGMPAKKVIANLGKLQDYEIENFRTALAASRQGKRAVIASVVTPPTKPQANLDYLDVAASLALWRRYGLDQLCRDLLPAGDAQVEPADVLASLVIHRLVDPGSKIHATRWFGTTALPELLDLPAEHFNNTRLHRVLNLVTEQTPGFMARLPALYLDHQPSDAFSVLYVDITDATFEGAGPELACLGRAKNDVIRQRIGIVLVCNQRGLPLRWKILAGNAPEAPELIQQMKLAARTPWGRKAPIFADRAVGKTAYLAELASAGVPFVTALCRNEFPTYAPQLIDPGFAELSGDKIAERLQERGFERVDDTLLLRELGAISPTTSAELSPVEPLDVANPGRSALQRARAIADVVDTGAAPSRNQAMVALGYHEGTAKGWCKLLKLTPELQNEVLSGKAVGLPLRRLIQLSSLEPGAQRTAFDALLADREAGKLRKLPRQPSPKPKTKPGQPPALCVRGVAYFNPKMCDQQRANAQKKLDKISSFVEELNASAVHSTPTEHDLLAKLEHKLRKHYLLKVYDVSTHTIQVGERQVPQVECQLRQNEWSHRRLLDGFSLLTTHPEVELSPFELCSRYRAKDTVEKDFQVIKSVLKMLPVRHHTDEKVLAHVTICVLALLLERLLRDELKGTLSPELALEVLATCHLNRYGHSPESRAYLVTEPDEPQKKILRLLKLQHLVDDNRMIDEIHPK